MLTTKQFRKPFFARLGFLTQPKYIFQAIAITALAVIVVPSVSSVISHRLQTEAAGGRSCLRVSADRTSQVRKYGADCDI